MFFGEIGDGGIEDGGIEDGGSVTNYLSVVFYVEGDCLAHAGVGHLDV